MAAAALGVWCGYGSGPIVCGAYWPSGTDASQRVADRDCAGSDAGAVVDGRGDGTDGRPAFAGYADGSGQFFYPDAARSGGRAHCGSYRRAFTGQH